MARRLAFSSLAFLVPCFLAAGALAAQESATASGLSGNGASVRDVRMAARSSWDYQPGQGPKRTVHDSDFFFPKSAPDVTAPLTPPPPVQNADWRAPPPSEDKLPVKMPSFEPATREGLDLGLQVSHNHYHEPDLDPMKTQGPIFGLTAAYTVPFADSFFARAEGRAAGGTPHYKHDGYGKDTPSFIGETRLLLGADILRSHWGLSPFIGIGYRFTHADLRDAPNDGVGGYRRYGHYLFAPIGLEPRINLGRGDRLSLRAEFDPLLRGWQEDKLSTISSANPDIIAKQKAGYGLRGELNYEADKLSFGPFVNYWNINQSERSCDQVDASTAVVCTLRPHNHTLEYGVNFRYHFDP